MRQQHFRSFQQHLKVAPVSTGGRRRLQPPVKSLATCVRRYSEVAHRCEAVNTGNLQTQQDIKWPDPSSVSLHLVSLCLSQVCARGSTSWCRTPFACAAMPSLRHSYTVTVPDEPAAFPRDKPELRRKTSSLSRSMLVSTFVGLLINQAKVSAPLLQPHSG